ncbi:hypothetical protein F5Y19DRAFT_462682 [Xylariaceae sp. FL1651]|nr:hypothetical protein F5Y19DRAFT_462682 [Xylariaceae sp. FL1651]
MEVLALIGLFIVLRALYKFVRNLYIYDLLPFFDIYRQTSRLDTYLRTKDGSLPWAFVTNAGDGIGRGFAERLAAYGFNIVLHGAAPHEIAQLRTALERKYPSRQYRTLIVHPAFFRDSIYVSLSDIQREFSDLSLKVFVNNAGWLSTDNMSTAGAIENYSDRELANAINRWTVFPTLLTSLLAPRLAECAPSLVLNVEAAEDLSAPMIPVYAPCKAYLETLTMELALEMKALGRNVEVFGLRVGQIAGVGRARPGAKKSRWFQPSVNTFVEAALGRVGCGERLMAPYCWYAFMAWWPKLLPNVVMDALRVKTLEDQYGRCK